ncbi:CDP-glycerol glycerophosphotransferase family protein [Guptibacillus hwajinpoensis]|uniref:CDP-glycerol glycerophosphotransferase family protein n=1 Tax=Guptibacillus hwajinpoensis TaxID=208199 RepID=UPI001CD47AB9|nr:CDP-glycerol glycerophosphotransferase family protein [Pseudalkalibacillus hwajinpoensis]MCA0991403.1 CDP-glycerol glycerophosphotransferase family protein [Pseudalkalibacillus hwajinpoensis]
MLAQRERIERSHLAVKDVIWDGETLGFTIENEEIESLESLNLCIINRQNQGCKWLEFNQYHIGDHIKISIASDDLMGLDTGKWDFFMVERNNKSVSKIRIGVYEAPIASREHRYLKPIIESEDNSWIPYLTERNGLSLHVGRTSELEKVSFEIIKFESLINYLEEDDDRIVFTIDQNFPSSPLANLKSGTISCKIFSVYNSLEGTITFQKEEVKDFIDGQGNLSLHLQRGNILEVYSLINDSINEGRTSSSVTKRLGTERSSKVIKGQLHAQNLRVSDGNILFDVPKSIIEHATEVQFYLQKRKGNELVNLSIQRSLKSELEEICIPASQFIQVFMSTSRWDLYVEIHHTNLIEVRRVGEYNNPFLHKQRYVGHLPISEELYVSPYLTNDHEFSIYVSTEEQYLKSKHPGSVSLHRLNLRKNGELHLTASVMMKNRDDFEVDRLILRLRSDKSKTVSVPCDKVFAPSGHKQKVRFRINLNEIEFEQFYWDFFISVKLTSHDKTTLIRVVSDNFLIHKQLKHRMMKFTINQSNGYMIYPYITINGGVSITYRYKGEYEGLKYKFNEYVAYYLYLLFYWNAFWKPTWLIHEKYSETAQDNAYYFFKHCFEEHKDKKVYYVIKKGSEDERNLAPYKERVVYFMSIKHLFLILSSKVIVSSEAKGHGYAWRVARGPIRDYLNKKRYVFLQHGVLGLKKVENTFKIGSANSADLFVVSSDFEKQIVMDHFGYKAKNIIVTGLSRWDVVEDRSHEPTESGKKEVFLMPTWRNWLDEVEEGEFILSDYYKAYNALLNSNKLHETLKKNNLLLNFYVHPKFMPYVSHFTSEDEHVRVIQFGEEKINDLLMRSSMLITDYSSVAWEMYYQKKPVLFFHFDLSKYSELQGSYMDLNKELFGDVAYSSDELVTKFEDYARTNFAEKPEISSKRFDYFNYIDNGNSSRIFAEIKKKEKEVTRKKSLKEILKSSDIVTTMWRRYKKYPIIRQFGVKFLATLKSH